jgi:hypothetical protein
MYKTNVSGLALGLALLRTHDSPHKRGPQRAPSPPSCRLFCKQRYPSRRKHKAWKLLTHKRYHWALGLVHHPLQNAETASQYADLKRRHFALVRIARNVCNRQTFALVQRVPFCALVHWQSPWFIRHCAGVGTQLQQPLHVGCSAVAARCVMQQGAAILVPGVYITLAASNGQ